MKKKLLLTISLLFMGTLLLSAQQQVMFTQYMFNGLAINPAYAGSHQTVSITALAREQWTGIDGAPSTQTFSIHSGIKDNTMGLGGLLFRDEIGLTDQIGGYLSYAYKIQTSGSGVLSLGLQGGFTNYNSKLTMVEGNDAAFASDVNETHPNVGVGAYYSTERFYFGGLVLNIICFMYFSKKRNK